MLYIPEQEFFITQCRMEAVTVFRVNLFNYIRLLELALHIEQEANPKARLGIVSEFLRITTDLRKPEKRKFDKIRDKLFGTAYRFNFPIPKEESVMNNASQSSAFGTAVDRNLYKGLLALVDETASAYHLSLEFILSHMNIFQLVILSNTLAKRKANEYLELLNIEIAVKTNPKDLIEEYRARTRGETVREMSLQDAIAAVKNHHALNCKAKQEKKDNLVRGKGQHNG